MKNSEQPEHLVCCSFPILASFLIIHLGGRESQREEGSERFLSFGSPGSLDPGDENHQLEPAWKGRRSEVTKPRAEIHTIQIWSWKYDSLAFKPKHQPLLPRTSQNILFTYFIQFNLLKRVISTALLLKSLMRKEIVSCLLKWLGQFLLTLYKVCESCYLPEAFPFHRGLMDDFPPEYLTQLLVT